MCVFMCFHYLLYSQHCIITSIKVNTLYYLVYVLPSHRIPRNTLTYMKHFIQTLKSKQCSIVSVFGTVLKTLSPDKYFIRTSSPHRKT